MFINVFLRKIKSGWKIGSAWSFLGLSILILLIVTFAWIFPTLDHLKKETSKLQVQMVENAFLETRYFFEFQKEHLLHIGYSLAGIKDFQASEASLERFLDNEIKEIVILDKDGREKARISGDEIDIQTEMKNQSQSKAFSQAIRGKVFLGNIFWENNIPFIKLTEPIWSPEKEVVGVLTAKIDLTDLWNSLSEIKLGKSGIIYIVDKNGRLVFYPGGRDNLRGVDLFKRSPVRTIIQDGRKVKGLSREDFYVNEKGKKVHAAGILYPELYWAILFEQETSESYAARNKLILVAVILLGIGFLLSLVLSKIISALTRSSRALLKAKEIIEKEKIGLEMQVKERTKKLDDLAKNLDQKVKERTRELESAKKKLMDMLKDVNESKMALMNILEDIEEARREADDERNRTLSIITNFTDGLLVFDDKNNLFLINPRAEDFFSVKAEEITGSSMAALGKVSAFKPLTDFLKEFIRQEKETAKNTISKKGGNKKIFRKEMTVREKSVLEITIVPIMAREEETGTLVILHDISRERMVEKMKTEFVSIAAHQLRTPLSAIKWTLRMLLDGDLGKITEEQEGFIKKTYQSNERMIRLINDLLNVARIEEGRFLYKPALVQFEDMVQEVVDSYARVLEKKEITVEFVKPKKKMPRVMADDEKIKLAVQNLLDNAVRYTPACGKIIISTNYNKNKIEFSIKDSGMGIPKDQQKRIFTKFFRAANATKTDTEGSGLGLFIVNNIIRAHKGEIWFESKKGKGTTFYFSLPVKK